jgi:hypothetical protein
MVLWAKGYQYADQTSWIIGILPRGEDIVIWGTSDAVPTYYHVTTDWIAGLPSW